MGDTIKIAFAFIPDGIIGKLSRPLRDENVEVKVFGEDILERTDELLNCSLFVIDFSGDRGLAKKVLKKIRDLSGIIRILIIVPVDQISILEKEFGLYDDYLNKPFKPEHLLYKIKLNIRLINLFKKGLSSVEHFNLLSDIASKLARAENFYDTLHLVAKRIADYLGVMRCSIMVVMEGEKEMIMVSTSDNDRLFKLHLKLEKYPEVREIIKLKRPLEISDVSKSVILKDFNRNLKEVGIKYICLIPINDINEFMGLIFVRDNKEQSLPAVELDFLTLVGEIIGIFFNNSRFLSEVRSTTKSLTSELESMEYTLSRLREDRDFLNDLIQDAIEGIIITNIDGQILVINKTTEKMLGYSGSEVIEKMRIQDLLPQEYSEDIIDEFHTRRFGSRTTISMGKKLFVSKKREAIPVILTARMIGHSQEFSGIIWQFIDMRELINAQEKLAELTENLEIARKKAFTAALAATAAHEMNQPLQSIMGYVELLTKRAKEGTIEYKYLQTINQECERMAQIIKNIASITTFKTKEYVGSAKIIDIGDDEGEKE